MGKLGDECMEDVRKARAWLQCSGEPDLAAGLDEWIAEQEPKTVTLHGASGNAYEYRSITSIGSGCYNPQVVGVWRNPGGAWSDSGEPASVTESRAEVTTAARAIWPEFDCEGAEPRLQPTVTLHGVNNGIPYDFVSIERLDKWSGCTRVEGCEADGTCGYRLVTELIADITALARKVWPDWSCPGAEPPVVVIDASSSKRRAFREIDLMRLDDDGLWVCGHTTDGCYSGISTDATEADVRAACAAAGVSYPPEEKLLPAGDTYQDEYPDEPEVSKGAGKTPWHPGRCPCCGVEDGSRQRIAELEAEVEYWRQANSEQVDADLASWHAMRRERDEARKRATDWQRKWENAISEMNDAVRHHAEYAKRMTDWRETETCGYCSGSGRTGEECAYCNGTGVVVRREGATSG